MVGEVGAEVAAALRDLTLRVYRHAEGVARERGIILADTKLEFGARPDGTIVLADEVLTPDSSRFWQADDVAPGRAQPSYDKDIVRGWLTSPASGWDRTSGEAPPPLPDDGRRAHPVAKLGAIDSKLGFSTKTRALLVLQITFVFGVWVTLLSLLKGGRVLMQPRFEALPVLEMLAEQGITDAAFVPTMLRKFLSLDRAVSEPLAACIKLDRILTGGEPLGRALSRQMRDFLPKTGLADIYGLTETCSSDFFLMPDEQDRFAGAIGRCSPGVRFRIADDEGNELPIGEVGELQIKTPFIMNGYLDEPDLTRAAFADDFFRTGDLARIRDDGLMELTGRAKELIMRGGAKIAPLELDGLLAQHPAVAAALTVGVPDRVMGECIHVLVVPRGGEQIDEAELRTWVASRIDRFKQPDTYHFGPELPTGRTGKVDRATLRMKICNGSL